MFVLGDLRRRHKHKREAAPMEPARRKVRPRVREGRLEPLVPMHNHDGGLPGGGARSDLGVRRRIDAVLRAGGVPSPGPAECAQRELDIEIPHRSNYANLRVVLMRHMGCISNGGRGDGDGYHRYSSGINGENRGCKCCVGAANGDS